MPSLLPSAKLVLFLSGILAVVSTQCTTVSKDEKARVLDKILRDEDEPAEAPVQVAEVPEATPEPTAQPTVEPTPELTAQPTVEPTPEPTPEPTAQPTVEPTPEPTLEPTAQPTVEPTLEPTAQSSPQKPVMPSRQTIARLPLPRGVGHSDLIQFMNAHADVLVPYQPLVREWLAYARGFANGANASETELSSMRLRIQQDFPRAHWLFVWGLHQTSFMLLGKSGNSIFLIDRQEDFLGHMSLLLFLSTELQSLSNRSEYREVLKKFYRNANAKYFKRPLIDRPPKPEGLLRPEAQPKLVQPRKRVTEPANPTDAE